MLFGLLLLVPAHDARDVISRIRGVRAAKRGRFSPTTTRTHKPTILTFHESWDTPFFIRVGGSGGPITGELDRRGQPIVHLPALRRGRYAIQMSTDQVEWSVVGVLIVKESKNTGTIAIVVVAVGAAVTAGALWYHTAAKRKKRQKRSDEGERYQPPRNN
jgi:hypothetical protein